MTTLTTKRRLIRLKNHKAEIVMISLGFFSALWAAFILWKLDWWWLSPMTGLAPISDFINAFGL